MEKGKILLVDDSPDEILLLSDFLRANDYSVITAHSGVTALAGYGKTHFDLCSRRRIEI